MKHQLPKQMIRIPNSSAALLFDSSMRRLLPHYHSNESFDIVQSKDISRIGRKIKQGFNVENLAKGIVEHGNYITLKNQNNFSMFSIDSWNLPVVIIFNSAYFCLTGG